MRSCKVHKDVHPLLLGMQIIRVNSGISNTKLEKKVGLKTGKIARTCNQFSSRVKRNFKLPEIKVVDLDKILNYLGYELVLLKEDEPLFPLEIEEHKKRLSFEPSKNSWLVKNNVE